ncbi:MAG TPA: hypothetical protein VK249_01665 [Anaerolineales bacterium]|nr:hypothetical protein [Anaerolineales bacterium]
MWKSYGYIISVMFHRALLLVAVAALFIISPAPVYTWQLSDRILQRVSPSGNRVVVAETSADFDQDGIQEQLIITGVHASISTGPQIRWQSPPAWHVQQGLVADLNRDGLPEAVLLVWRPFKPWPVDTWLPNGGRIKNFHDAGGMSCHIILIGWYRNSFRERWAGSALAQPIRGLAAADLTGNGQQYLVTLEGEYDDPAWVPSRRLKVWEWNGFGFTVVTELVSSFSTIRILQEHGRELIQTR